MPFNTQAALQAGYSQDEINQFLASQNKGISPTSTPAPTPQPTVQPAPVAPQNPSVPEQDMRSKIINGAIGLLPTAGAIGGGIIGGVAAGPFGAIPAAAAGAGIGEGIRQKIKGENTNLPQIRNQAALGAAGEGAGAVIGAGVKTVGKAVTEGIPERIMNSVFKQPLKETGAAIKAGTSLGKEALQRGEMGTTEGIYKTVLTKINNLEDSLQSLLLNSDAKVPISDIEKTAKPLIDKYIQSGNTQAAQAITDRITAIAKVNGDFIPVSAANEVKRALYDEARKSYGTEASANMEGLKSIARGIKEGIENVPGVSQINKDLSYYGRVADSMVDKLARSARNNMGGLTDTILAAGGGPAALPVIAVKHIIGSTAGKTALANGLSTAGEVAGALPNMSSVVGQGVVRGINKLVSPTQDTQDNTQNNGTTQSPSPHTMPSIPQNENDNTVPGQKKNPLEGYKVDGQPISKGDAALVDAIANYKIDPTKSTSLRTNERKRLMELVTQYDPSYDQTQYNARASLRKDFTSGKSANNIRSLNTAIGHLQALSDTGNALGNTTLPVINTVKNAASQAVGQPQVTKFNDAINAVAGEMSTVFKGSSGTDEEIKSWKQQMNASQSPEQIKEGINQMIELMGSRLSAFNSQWESGMGKPKDFRFLSPKSRQILTNLGQDIDTIDPMAQ